MMNSFKFNTMLCSMLLLLALYTTITNALQPIFPDQLGETDWSIESLAGTVKHSIHVEEHSFVSTSASEIARLDKHGNFDWLVKLQDAEISNMITYKRSLFTFSNADNLLRLWNTVDGTLLWDCFLGYKLSNSTSSSSASLDIANQVVIILSDNCLSFVNAKGILMWQWCAVDSTVEADGTHVVLSHLINPTISAANASSSLASSASSNAARAASRRNSRGSRAAVDESREAGGIKVAVGCVVQSNVPSSECIHTAVIMVNYKTQHVYMDTFPGLPTQPHHVHGIIQAVTKPAAGTAEEEDDYSPSDVIFGVIPATASSPASVKLIDLHSSITNIQATALAAAAAGTADGAEGEEAQTRSDSGNAEAAVTLTITADMLGMQHRTQMSTVVSGFVVAPFANSAEARGAVLGHPGVTICQEHSSSCRTFFAVRSTAGGDAATAGAWGLNPVLYCDAADGASAGVVGYQQYPLMSHTNGNIGSSTSASWDHSPGVALTVSCSRLVQAKTSTTTAEGLTFTAHIAGFSRSSSSSLIAPLPSVFLHSLTGGLMNTFPQVSATTSSVRALVIGSAGAVFMIGGDVATAKSAVSSASSAVAAASILWSKEHGISHIEQVVVLDHASYAATPTASSDNNAGDSSNNNNDNNNDSANGDDEDEDDIPDLHDRLKMQQAEVVDVIRRLIYAAQHPLEMITMGGGVLVNRVRKALLNTGLVTNDSLNEMPIFAAAANSYSATTGGKKHQLTEAQLSKDTKLGFRKLAICLALVPLSDDNEGGNLFKIRVLGIDFSSRGIAWSVEPDLPPVHGKTSLVKLLSAFVGSAGSTDSSGKDYFEVLVSTTEGTVVLSVNVPIPGANADTYATTDGDRFHIEKHVLHSISAGDSRVVSIVTGVAGSGSSNSTKSGAGAAGAAISGPISSSSHTKPYVLLWSDYRATVYVPYNIKHHHHAFQHHHHHHHHTSPASALSTMIPINPAYKNLYANVWTDSKNDAKCVGVAVDNGGTSSSAASFSPAGYGRSKHESASSGVFQVVRINTTSCSTTATKTWRVGGIAHTCQLEVVSSLNFGRDEEVVVGVTAHATGDVVHSRATALGDDSVLLKSLNPHRILVTTVTPSHAAVPYADMSYTSTSRAVDANNDKLVSKPTLELLSSSVFLTLVDSVSGKILYRTEIPSATAPVHSVLIENQAVVTYWNTVSKRSELLSLALYEGMIDKHSLVPGANKPAISRVNLNPDGSRTVSSFGLSPPVAQYKTYILPRSVTAMGHSIPARGISHKNVLLGLNTNQLYALDLRQVSPRRPVNAPTNQEKEEGLQQYQPYLVLHPPNMVTYNNTLLGAITAVHSYPTALESSTIVLATSTNGIYVNRIMPSNGFDIMPSDFNHLLLLAILAAMAAAVAILRLMYRKKVLAAQWV